MLINSSLKIALFEVKSEVLTIPADLRCGGIMSATARGFNIIAHHFYKFAWFLDNGISTRDTRKHQRNCICIRVQRLKDLKIMCLFKNYNII